MKSLLFAPALLSFISAEPVSDHVSVATTAPSAPDLVAISQVILEPPLVELQQAPPPFVPVVVQDEARLDALKGELKQLGASLEATQQAVEKVAKQRDEARQEVSALAKANHEMLKEMKAFRSELEMAHKETSKWKEHAAKMERKANDQALATAALEQFRNELQGTMKDFQAMKGDIAKARGEFVDPIERANLKEELAQSKAKQDRLTREIEMALVAREKMIRESAQTRKEMDGKMASLSKEAQAAKALRDELRIANANKMKALADVEVLRKELSKSDAIGKDALAKLETAQKGLTALQAEKAAAMEARAVAVQERDKAHSENTALKKQLDSSVAQLENAKKEIVGVSGRLKDAEKAMIVTVRERDAAQVERDEARKQAEGALAQLEGSAMVIVKMSGSLQATKEAMMVATRQRDAAQSEMGRVQEKMMATGKELATIKEQAAKASEIAKAADTAQKEFAKKLADASGVIEKTQEEVQFLNRAKGGLQELLFKKTAEIRKLKGELRRMQASNDGPPNPAEVEEKPEGEAVPERSRAQALAD